AFREGCPKLFWACVSVRRVFTALSNSSAIFECVLTYLLQQRSALSGFSFQLVFPWAKQLGRHLRLSESGGEQVDQREANQVLPARKTSKNSNREQQHCGRFQESSTLRDALEALDPGPSCGSSFCLV